ncbi:MAG TPA: hypothetical protein PK950_02770 [Candidatus Paceibacterota bacterium]|nr:hypothetical protein [Candidatus Paceibacterota bacterium]
MAKNPERAKLKIASIVQEMATRNVPQSDLMKEIRIGLNSVQKGDGGIPYIEFILLMCGPTETPLESAGNMARMLVSQIMNNKHYTKGANSKEVQYYKNFFHTATVAVKQNPRFKNVEAAQKLVSAPISQKEESPITT